MLVAVIVALTPDNARSLLRTRGLLLDVLITCKQIGVAATDIRTPEIICIEVINTESGDSYDADHTNVSMETGHSGSS